MPNQSQPCQWITATSPYFASLGLATSDYPLINQLILSGQTHIERFCNRVFAQQQFDEQCQVLQDGSLILRNIPVAYISRFCTASGNWLTVHNSSATVANVATTTTALILTGIVSGVTTTTQLLYQTYPTLNGMAGAINGVGSGWSATVASGGFGNYPSGDLTPGQYGTALSPFVLASWSETLRQIRFDPNSGIIPGYGGSYDTGYQLPYYPVTGNPLVYTIRGDYMRVVYTGGFDPIPEDIKEVLSHLVIQKFQSPEGRIQGETIGNQYNYTLMDFDKAPASDRKILASYRRRVC